MSLRRSSALAITWVLGACSSSERVGQGDAAGRDLVPCAHGAAALAPVCSVERDRGGALTLRFPDGSFRRLRGVDDGQGMIAADGAEPARISILGRGATARIDVRIGDDRFRLPASLAAGTR